MLVIHHLLDASDVDASVLPLSALKLALGRPAIPAWDQFSACNEFFGLASVHDVELFRFDIQAAAGSGSGQTAVRSNPTAIPTEISRNRWMPIIHAGSARATSMTMG
jgi:hypothetical protein